MHSYNSLYELADFDAIIRHPKKPGIVQVSGMPDSQKAHFTNGLLRSFLSTDRCGK